MYSRDHLFVALGVPLSYWHPCVIIVSADENQYRVEVVAMLSLQFVGLPGNVVPLSAADGIYIRCYAEPVLQETPVFLLRCFIPRIGDGIPKIGYAAALPRMTEELLRSGLKANKEQNECKTKFLFHIFLKLFGAKILIFSDFDYLCIK